MESLSQRVGSIFQSLTSSIDKNVIQAETLRVLSEKHEKCENVREYVKLLVSNIAFNVESTKVVYTLLRSLIEQKQFPYIPGISQVTNDAQDRIEESMEQLFPIYSSKLVEHDIVDDEVIKKVESVFASSKIEQDLTIIFMEAFAEEKNREIFVPLFTCTPEEVDEVVKKYSSLYALMLLDQVEFEQQPAEQA
ncbi:hypothetical protein ACOJQI_20365 [Bacillus salacetis]|uniref:hypothetical protein n=1 Tax=Bacillus salacetis TaxID=2315464 RepID=UPI003BA3134B